jgi:hypothetical protein
MEVDENDRPGASFRAIRNFGSLKLAFETNNRRFVVTDTRNAKCNELTAPGKELGKATTTERLE